VNRSVGHGDSDVVDATGSASFDCAQ